MGGWKAQINFRATATYVTDQHGETYSLAELYPTSRRGLTFGWSSAVLVEGRDRTGTVDRRIAGTNQRTNTGTQVDFTLDLPSGGYYRVKIAQGDHAFSADATYVQLLDGNRPILTMHDSDGFSAPAWHPQSRRNFALAGLTADAWKEQSNNSLLVYFRSRRLTLRIGTPTAQTHSSAIGHLYVEYVGRRVARVMLPSAPVPAPTLHLVTSPLRW